MIGILAMNIAGFALPPAIYGYPAMTRMPGAADLAVWAAGFVFVDGKMRALFGMLFGASLLLVADRARAAGRDPVRVHLARMAWLLVIGLAHALLVWSGDILTLYAVVGTIAFAFHRQDPAALLVAGVLCLVAQGAILAIDVQGLFALRDAAIAHASPAILADWQAILDEIGPGDGSASRAAIAIARSGYGTILADRLAAAPAGFRDQIEIAGPETLGFMLIGMAALRGGVVTGGWPARRLLRLGGIATLLGLAGGTALLVSLLAGGLDPLAVYTAETIGGGPLRPLLAAGYAGLALGAWRTLAPARLAAAGRMALSNYLGTSLICTTLFYGYGFGLYARITRTTLLAPIAVIALLMLVWSPAWLARFRYGPAEWLWRSLARGQLQPMRKTLATISQ